jgi:MtN3 and saliva related transmembrane protein
MAARGDAAAEIDMAPDTLVSAIAAILTTAAFVPQALHILRRKETGAISLGMYVTLAAGVFCWLVFGLMIGNAPIVVANIVTLGLALSIIAMKLRYG